MNAALLRVRPPPSLHSPAPPRKAKASQETTPAQSSTAKVEEKEEPLPDPSSPDVFSFDDTDGDKVYIERYGQKMKWFVHGNYMGISQTLFDGRELHAIDMDGGCGVPPEAHEALTAFLEAARQPSKRAPAGQS